MLPVKYPGASVFVFYSNVLTFCIIYFLFIIYWIRINAGIYYIYLIMIFKLFVGFSYLILLRIWGVCFKEFYPVTINP